MRIWRRAKGVAANDGLLILVACIAATAPLLLATRVGVTGDTWLAVVAGEQIRAHGLPSIDHLTILGQGHRWVDQQWLAHIQIDELYRIGGLRTVIVGCQVFTAAAYLLAVASTRRHASSRATLVVAGVASLLFIYPATAPRTQSLAYLLFVAVVLLIAADSRRASLRVLAMLPILVLWANLHGSVVLAAALVAAHGVTVIRRRPAVGAALFLLPWPCLLASPYGTALLGYYRTMLVSSPFTQWVAEWQPTQLRLSPSLVVVAPFYVLVLASLYLVGRHRRALTATEISILALTGLAGATSIRNIVWFAIAAVCVLPRLLDRSLAERSIPQPRALNFLAGAAGVAIVVLVFVAAVTDANAGRKAFPAAAAAAAAAAHQPVFTTAKYGDWLIAEQPQLAGRVWMDARFEIIDPLKLRALVLGDAGIDRQNLLARYHVFVLDKVTNRKLVTYLRATGARTAFEDPTVVVLEKGAGSQ